HGPVPLAQAPLDAGRTVADLDACGGEAVAQCVGGGEVPGRAGGGPAFEQRVDERGHPRGRVGEPVARGARQLQHHAAQGAAGVVAVVGLQGVGGPLGDGLLQLEHRGGRGGGRAPTPPARCPPAPALLTPDPLAPPVLAPAVTPPAGPPTLLSAAPPPAPPAALPSTPAPAPPSPAPS